MKLTILTHPAPPPLPASARAIDPLECPKSKAQMRIIAFIQEEHSIKDIMKAQGIPDFQAPPPIPKFIDTPQAIDELPSYDSFEPSPDDF